MKKICFPTDFSELSLKVLPFAISMAKRHGAQLTVLHVVGHWSGMYPEAQKEELFAGVRQNFEGLRGDLEASLGESNVRFEALQGDVQNCIEGYCEVEKINLLIMSTHGHSGLKRIFMGSVTKSLIHTVVCPTLVFNPAAAEVADAEKIGSVLVPLDMDHISQVTIDIGTNFALKNNYKLDLLYALSDHRGTVGVAGVYGDARIYRSYKTFVQEETQLAKDELDKVIKGIQAEHKDIEVGCEISEEPADQAIADYCDKNPHSLIVIQTHVKSNVSSFLLGSTAERVIHSVNVPMLILNKRNGKDLKQTSCCS